MRDRSDTGTPQGISGNPGYPHRNEGNTTIPSRIADGCVLITGGLGFVGATLAKSLVEAGNSVTLLDSVTPAGSTAEALGLVEDPLVTCVQGDVTDPKTFEQLADDYTHIVHAAAVLGVQRVARESLLTLDVNIRGTQMCLEFAARQRDLRRALVLSTSEVYGRHANGTPETASLRLDTDSLRWSYAASKVAAEFLAMAYQAEHGVPTTIVRPFNVYGPHRSLGNAMTTFVSRALRHEEITVTGDGRQRRSWCYITDFVDGIHRCLAQDAAIGETFNIGNDSATLGIQELAYLVVELSGSRSAVRLLGDATPDVLDRAPDISKARRLLGFRPEVGLEAGVDSVIRAMREVRGALI
ncbi:NAD-dependent epimerase/dehydratase family protein [Streptomyces sp. NBC_00012]|uniref:NAD-dependent epimerase/dehydratase family protein n=1 Tax=unclassified Streptomyces TaxID=2593676 RepID=UPI00324C7D96